MALAPSNWDEPGVPTERELEILQLIADGYTRPQAARELGIAYPTVKAHMTGLFRRLDALNCAHAYKLCLERGYIELRGTTNVRQE